MERLFGKEAISNEHPDAYADILRRWPEEVAEDLDQPVPAYEHLGELTYELDGHQALPVSGESASDVQAKIDTLREDGAKHIRWSRYDEAVTLVDAEDLKGLGR